MPGRGRFFVLNDAELRALKAVRGDRARREAIDEMERTWPEERSQDADKAWYFLYILFEFGELTRDPLNRLLVGGTRLHRGESCVINLISSALVPKIVRALRGIDRRELREALGRVDGDYFLTPPRRDKAEADYVLGWFDKILRFLEKTQGNVIFSADM